jgi:hypothetical protein
MLPSVNSQLQRARTVIQSLVHGLDPETGDDLPKNSIVNKIEVNRALSMGVLAIDQMTARLARRAQLPDKVGKVWTEEEEQRLRDEFSGGEPIPLIATKHSRTIRAVEARLEKLGLLTLEQRTTNSTFVNKAQRDDK